MLVVIEEIGRKKKAKLVTHNANMPLVLGNESVDVWLSQFQRIRREDNNDIRYNVVKPLE